MRAINLFDAKSFFTGALDFDSTDEGITPRRLPAFTRLSIPEEMQRVDSIGHSNTWFNLSAGVSNPKVFLGLVLSCFATASSWR